MKLIKLPDGKYVNPEHVVGVRSSTSTKGGERHPITQVMLHFRQPCGNNTGWSNADATLEFPGDIRDEIAALFQA